MTTPAKQRLAECAQSNLQCDLPGCGFRRQRWGRMCEQHDATNQRTGDPRGRTIRIGELSPYLKITSRYLKETEENLEVAVALAWLHRLIYADRPTSKTLQQSATPIQRLNFWLARMRRQGIYPIEVMAMVCAMYLLRECDPPAFVSDRHFKHQMSIRVVRLTRPRHVKEYRGGEGSFKYDTVTVGVRELLANHLIDGVGLTSLRIAKTIQPHIQFLPEAQCAPASSKGNLL